MSATLDKYYIILLYGFLLCIKNINLESRPIEQINILQAHARVSRFWWLFKGMEISGKNKSSFHLAIFKN